ncbi:hypothetical protein [Mesorhizobium sp.]|uniref:hypothetical protein n=1 Tax=Mesorhizobium sp. TaxID=1871066 RepID=UPI0025C0A0A4|nr:hypothetical protein [Mesorhizobium sp.]
MINALAAKGDVKGLMAIEIKPYSSGPKKMIRWRELAIAAIGAGKKQPRAK